MEAAVTSIRSVRVAILLATAAWCVGLPGDTASAGRLIASGHDSDSHCGHVSNEPDAHRQCHFFKVAVEYVRAGAPDPRKPVLVLDRAALDVSTSLDRIYGRGVVPRRIIDPRSAAFRSAPITTALYSAVVVASSRALKNDPTPPDLDEVGSAPDSNAIKARAGDLRAFFHSGGGIFLNSGGMHGDGPGDPYYAMLPITVQPARVTYPFTLTDDGRRLGFLPADVTCCPTHNTFDQPSVFSALQAVDVDAAGRVVTLFADTPSIASLGDPPISRAMLRRIAAALPSAKRCVRGRRLRLRLIRPKGLRFSRASVYVNGRRVRRMRGRAVTRPFKITLRGKRTRVRIVILTTGKRKVTIRRTYRRCGLPR